MSGTTSKWLIPYAAGSDTVAGFATFDQNRSNYLDLLLGETGSFTMTGTSGSTNVSLSRTYPGNWTATVQGTVIFQMRTTVASGVVLNIWVDTWTGTGSTITGFTINWIASTSQSGRVVLWRFLPVV
jgi:hypothetical protein